MKSIAQAFLLSSLFFVATPSVVCATQQSQAPTTHQETKQQSHNMNDFLKDHMNQQTPAWLLIIIAFAAGILVSFTPCIYPMIPITIGILQIQRQQSLLYNFFSALTYVAGIACVYATLGYISATSSLIFGRWLASPWFIFFIVLFFLYLAFSMFGFYEIYTPRFLSRSSDVNRKPSLLTNFIFGAISGTVASPCLTPALALLLGIAAQQASPILGFLILFSFALGMGSLLILVGTFSGAVSMLPRAGEWMDEIKRLFGFIMLAVCVNFLQPFLPAPYNLYLYALITLNAGVYFIVGPRKKLIKTIVGYALLVATALLLLWSR
ncbi:MAG: cytochrome c biogenesis protein CcdA [Candidatus Babeliales bacterium]